MDDRIAEIRKALARYDEWQPMLNVDDKVTLVAAARAYADLLDSDALIIRRDETGGWPASFIEGLIDAYVFESRFGLREHLDALASSQGVEP